MTTFLSYRDIYESAICGIVPQVGEGLWVATADIKDVYVGAVGRAVPDPARFMGFDPDDRVISIRRLQTENGQMLASQNRRELE